MVESIVNRRYIYSHDCKWLSRAIDVHHITAQKSRGKGLLCLFAVVLLANTLYLFLMKLCSWKLGSCGDLSVDEIGLQLATFYDKSITSFYWSFLIAASLVKLMRWKPAVKESVLVMPSFGVQLETEYKSGRIVRHFVPISKILKPVLVECVTPIICYWSLSLILREEVEQMLVFKELHPPLKMLVPVWKALCAACESKESSHISTEDGR